MTLYNVNYIPTLRRNLIAGSALKSYYGKVVQDKLYHIDAELYFEDSIQSISPVRRVPNQKDPAVKPKTEINQMANPDEQELWHQCFSHINYPDLISSSKTGSIKEVTEQPSTSGYQSGELKTEIKLIPCEDIQWTRWEVPSKVSQHIYVYYGIKGKPGVCLKSWAETARFCEKEGITFNQDMFSYRPETNEDSDTNDTPQIFYDPEISETKKLLGVEFTTINDGVKMNQSMFIQELKQKFSRFEVKESTLPISYGVEELVVENKVWGGLAHPITFS
ncbi:hypothetical protein CHUAL_004361 [Chamberlinius hualienensis]